MEPKDIQQMFRDAAALRSMGPFDPAKAETESRFAELSRRYRAECLRQPEPRDEKPRQPDWKAALQYIASLLQQMDLVAPDSAETNRAAWAIVAPAVQKFYEGESAGKKDGPAE